MPEGFSILCNRTTAAPCHPELAAKSVETKSKRDFIPLPGVSGSYNLYMKEILNSDKFRKPPRLTFQNDMGKNPPSFHLYKKGAKALLPLFILPAPHLLISLFFVKHKESAYTYTNYGRYNPETNSTVPAEFVNHKSCPC